MSWSSRKTSKEEQVNSTSVQKTKSRKFLPSNPSASSFPSFSSSSQLHEDFPADHLKIADRGIKAVVSDGLCQTCANIPWQRLPKLVINGRSNLPKIYHTTRALQTSACRVCRFLWDVIVSTELKLFTSEPPYQLEVYKYSAVADEKISMLRFKNSETSTVWPIGKDPHVLVTQKPSTHDKLPHTNLLLRGYPIEYIRMSISRCELKHVDSCTLFRPDTLRALKFLDCEQKQIVPAPPGCRYVALSYVWGPRQSVNNVEDLSKLGVLPKTVSDSCLVALSLGYKYLWVDRYCIDQPNEREKMEQVAQMADIYASAQLTIIAAAGDHADYGLPGIQQRSENQPLQPIVGTVQLLAHPSPLQVRTLLSSTWASRAWTFQECYFSKRRLFFTEDQVEFVCNSSPTKMRSTSWIPFAPHDKSQEQNDFVLARGIVGGYAGRQLTYDSDALTAIVSALHSLSAGNVQHIWGLPFCLTSTNQGQSESDMQLPLLWRHNEPCLRRKIFPSWSPIAWSGKMTWFAPLHASAYNIRLCDSPTRTTAVPWTTSYAPGDFESAPRYIEVTAKMARLGTIKTSVLASEEPTGEQATFLTFPLDDTLDIILVKSLWDIDPSMLDTTIPVRGVLLSPGPAMPSVYGPMILLVQQRGNYYERVGIMKLGAVLNYSHALVLHEHRYMRFVDRTTGEIRSHDCGDLSGMNSLESKDIKLAFLEQDRWERFFEEDTIVLG